MIPKPTLIKSTQADFVIDSDGQIVGTTWKLGKCLVTHKFLSKITSFDTKKYIGQHGELPKELNIQFIGYWMGDEYIRNIF